MKKMMCLTALALSCGLAGLAQAQTEVTTIEEYNERLPVWGISWKAGSNSVSGYYPSFYTGFVPRQQKSNRIHIRMSRGNQTRVSIILDEATVMDYLYDLKTRRDFYNQMMSEGYIDISPRKSALVPHVEYFNGVVSNGMLETLDQFDAGQITKAELYRKSLAALKTLNSKRTFDVSIDLAQELLAWRSGPLADANDEIKTQESMVLANEMLWGRVNLVRKLTSAEREVMQSLKNNASVLSDEGFVVVAAKLFDSITEDKYSFKVLDDNGTFVAAKRCDSGSDCTLTYPELSTIYPTGSHKGSTRDEFGNRISSFATQGLHPFIDTGSRGDVDNIRKEPYYGFAPKMDYEGVGNGFHNPAVRHRLTSAVKEALGIDDSHKTYWPVMRGRVSNGCARLPLGHIWEMRQIFPVQNALMKGVYWFGNDSRDFDLFDIDADGTKEIMGSKYYIQYGLQGSSGLAKREGEGLNLNSNISKYYASLYGKKNVYEEKDGTLTFFDPSVSIHTESDIWSGSRSRKKVVSRKIVQGDFKLYEQDYEQDKAQFYTSKKISGFNSGLTGGGKESLSKRFVRLMGRIKGCAPFADQKACGAQAFEKEKTQILKEIR